MGCEFAPRNMIRTVNPNESVSTPNPNGDGFTLLEFIRNNWIYILGAGVAVTTCFSGDSDEDQIVGSKKRNRRKKMRTKKSKGTPDGN